MTRVQPLKAKSVPVKPKGCKLRFWDESGAIGINDRLVVFNADIAVARRDEIDQRDREALADHMIELWTRFKKPDRRR